MRQLHCFFFFFFAGGFSSRRKVREILVSSFQLRVLLKILLFLVLRVSYNLKFQLSESDFRDFDFLKKKKDLIFCSLYLNFGVDDALELTCLVRSVTAKHISLINCTRDSRSPSPRKEQPRSRSRSMPRYRSRSRSRSLPRPISPSRNRGRLVSYSVEFMGFLCYYNLEAYGWIIIFCLLYSF